MRPTPPYEPPGCSEELLDLIEPFLDGELDERSTGQIEAHLAECADCSAQLEEARRVRAALRSLPIADCPQDVVESVLRTAAKESAGAEPLRPLGGWQRGAARSPAPEHTETPRRLWLVAATVLFAIVGAALLFDLPRTPPQEERAASEAAAPTQLSAEEISQAEQEARMALALFAQVSDRVGQIVQEEVIGRRVSAAPYLALDVIRGRTENPRSGVSQ